MADQTLNVQITGDASSLETAAVGAGTALEKLRGEAEAVDGQKVEITPELELSRLNRDRANLEQVLAGIEKRKASPDVGLDLVQLQRDEAKVKAEIDKIDSRKAEIEVDVQTSGFTELREGLAAASLAGSSGGGLTGLASTLGGIGGSAGSVAAVGTALAGVAVGIGAVTKEAADMETLRLQLEAVFGDGQQAIEVLQQFAAETPFALDETARAARSLGLAGVDLQEIPTWLTDIGDAAAVSGAGLDDLTVVVTQMLNKGAIQAEEIQQLAERGVPAWQALADSQGKSVAEVQAMVTAGELGGDAVQKFVEQLAIMFPTAMSDQADTFNGKMSTLSDTLAQSAANLGGLFLPAAEDTADALIAMGNASVFLTDKLGSVQDMDFKFEDLDKDASTWENIGTTVKDVGALIGKAVTWDPLAPPDSLDPWGEGVVRLFEGVQAEIDATGGSVGGLGTQFELLPADDLAAELERVNGELDELIGNFSILSGSVDVFRANLATGESLQAFTKGLKDGFGRADKTLLADYLDDLQTTARARLDRGDDPLAVGASIRKSLNAAAKEAGPAGRRVIEQFTNQEWPDILLQIKADQDSVSETETALDRTTHDRIAVLYSSTDDRTRAQATEQLDAIAEKNRAADILVHADTSSAEAKIAALTITRTVDIILNPIGSALSGADAQGIAGGGGGGPGGSGGTGKGGGKTDLAPKAAPLRVYLDGAEIADHLELRGRRLATSSARRRP